MAAVDPDALAEAVKRFFVASDMKRSDQPNTPYVKIMGPSVGDVETLLVAARAFLEAPTAEWCETHESNWPSFHFGDGQIRRCRYAQGAGLRGQCDKVGRLRLVAEEETG